MTDRRARLEQLLQQLLTDPQARARFHADPAAVASEAGLADLGDELRDQLAGPEALDARESRSSLAGVLMAAAIEGVALGSIAQVAHGAGQLSSAGAPSADSLAPPPSGDLPTDAAVGVEAPGARAAAAPVPADPYAARTMQAIPWDDEDGDDGEGEDHDEDGEDEEDEDEDEEDEDEEDEDEDEDDDDEEDDEDDDDDDEDDDDDLGELEDDDSDLDDDASATKLGLIDYPGDDAERGEYAAWMAGAARARGLPAELPMMASLVESNMQNLSGGDRDSVGFFQMRTGIWDTGEYAGFQDDPERQLDWFLDHAEQVKAQRLASGQSCDDPKQYGEWIADVERPAAQYRGRYQEHLEAAQQLLRSIPDDNGESVQALAEAGGSQQGGERAQRALALVRTQLGRPYRWGGTTPEGGFDCSGIVQWAYRKVGISIPRVTQEQIGTGKHIARGDLRPGDLVFFRDPSGDVHHVGISMGGDKFVHAPRTGDVVKESSLDEPYYKSQFTGGRRLDVSAGRSTAADARVMRAIRPDRDDD